MHQIIRALVITFSLFISSVYAAPYHYTFSGNIQYIELDGAFLSYIDIDGDPATTNDNFQSGEVIEYTFLVDFDLPGFCSGPLATSYSATCTGVDILDSETANYFFTDLVSATKLAPPTEEGTTFNYGLSISNLGSLIADSAVFVVSPFNIPVESWVATDEFTAGTVLVGTDAWAAPNGGSPYGRVHSVLTLESITPVVIEKCKKRRHHKHHHGDHYDDDEDYHKHKKGRHHKYDNDDHDDNDHDKRKCKKGRHHNHDHDDDDDDEHDNDDHHDNDEDYEGNHHSDENYGKRRKGYRDELDHDDNHHDNDEDYGDGLDRDEDHHASNHNFKNCKKNHHHKYKRKTHRDNDRGHNKHRKNKKYSKYR